MRHIADMTGVCHSTLSRFASGKTSLRYESAIRLETALNLVQRRFRKCKTSRGAGKKARRPGASSPDRSARRVKQDGARAPKVATPSTTSGAANTAAAPARPVPLAEQAKAVLASSPDARKAKRGAKAHTLTAPRTENATRRRQSP